MPAFRTAGATGIEQKEAVAIAATVAAIPSRPSCLAPSILSFNPMLGPIVQEHWLAREYDGNQTTYRCHQSTTHHSTLFSRVFWTPDQETNHLQIYGGSQVF